MSCLAAPPAAPPAERAVLLLVAAAPSRARPRGRGMMHCAARGAAWGGARWSRRQLVLRRCSPAGESTVAGDGAPSRLLCLLNFISPLQFPVFHLLGWETVPGWLDGVVLSYG